MAFPDETVAATITFTQPAAEAVKAVMDQKNLPGYSMRLFISGGGCSGYQYNLALTNNIRPEDTIVETNGIKLVVDEVSIKYLQGATVDYVEGEAESGFRIDNPNQLSTCGCGQGSSDAEGEASEGCAGCG